LFALSACRWTAFHHRVLPLGYLYKTEEAARLARNLRQNELRAKRKAARTPEEREEIRKVKRIKEAARRVRERDQAQFK
jgi:hypothetical protein